MDTLQWRARISGLAFVSVGLSGMVFSYLWWNLDAPLLLLMSCVVTIGGGMLLSGRLGYYYYVLPVLGILAFLKSIGYYLIHGFTTLTLLFALLGVTVVGQFARAYWSSEAQVGIEA